MARRARTPSNHTGTLIMQQQIGNYMHNGDLFRRKVGRTTYIVGFATAYNAFGLIGPEHNGIFILDDTKRAVVLDRHMPQISGYHGIEPKTAAELQRLRSLSAAAFRAFIAGHPRSRDEYRSHARRA